MTNKPKTLKEMKKDLAEYARDDYHDGCYDTIEKIRAMLMERVEELQSEADKPENHDKLTYAYIAGQKWELLRIAGKERK